MYNQHVTFKCDQNDMVFISIKKGNNYILLKSFDLNNNKLVKELENSQDEIEEHI